MPNINLKGHVKPSCGLSFDTTTGGYVGLAATEKLGLWGVTPVVQPSGAAQAALTDSSAGTADGTVSPSTGLSTAGGNTYSDTAVNAKLTIVDNNFKEVCTLLNALRAALVTAGVIKGAA